MCFILDPVNHLAFSNFGFRKERKQNRNKRFCWENHRLLSIENQKCSALNQAIRTWLEHFDVLRLFTNRWVMFVKRLHLIFQRTNLPLNCWMKFTIYYVNFNLWEISMIFLYLHIYIHKYNSSIKHVVIRIFFLPKDPIRIF